MSCFATAYCYRRSTERDLPLGLPPPVPWTAVRCSGRLRRSIERGWWHYHHFLGTVSLRAMHHLSAFARPLSVFACAIRSMTHCWCVIFTTLFFNVIVWVV